MNINYIFKYQIIVKILTHYKVSKYMKEPIQKKDNL